MRGWLVGVVVLAGCFEHHSYDVDDYWTELGNTHCDRMLDCCTRADYDDWWTTSNGNRLDCVAAHDAPSYAETVRDDIRSGKITFDPAAAHSCIIALETMTCSDFQPGIRYRETYCEPPLRGHIPDGAGLCKIDEECVNRHCDDFGVCQPGIAAGGSCQGAPDLCDAPLRCQPSAVCGLGAPGDGATCSDDAQCEGDWCMGDGIFTSGTCHQACQG